MEQAAFDLATVLLVATPLMVFIKIILALVTRRLSLAQRGSLGARVELAGWLVLGAVDSHTLALWSTFTVQPQDLCSDYRPGMGADVQVTGGDFADYPVDVRCVWPDGVGENVVPWPLNAATGVLVAALVGLAVHATIRAGRRRARQRTPRTDHY